MKIRPPLKSNISILQNLTTFQQQSLNPLNPCEINSTRALIYETYHDSQLKIRPMLKSKDFILLYENKEFKHNRYTRLCQHVHSHTKRICADKYN